MPNHCRANPPLHLSPGSDWNGWGNGVANNRFQPAAAAGLTAATVPNLKLKWAFGFPGGTSAFAQPAVVGGRVFVGTDIGYVYSLDAATGCIYWSFRPDAGVRTAMTVGPITTHGKHRYAVFFGDLKANAYAIDAQTGAAIWKTHVEKNYATRVTAAPALYQGRLYVPISAWEGFQARVLDFPCCTATGSVSELDANTGRIIWKTYSIAQRPRPTHKNSRGVQQWAPAGVPIWNTPTVDPAHHAVYVGTGDASTYPAPPTTDAILALDLRTGKRLWSHQVYPGDSFIVGCAGAGRTENCPKVVGPDWDVPMSPMLKHLADGRTLIIFATKPGDVLALDVSRRGATVWHIDRPTIRPWRWRRVGRGHGREHRLCSRRHGGASRPSPSPMASASGRYVPGSAADAKGRIHAPPSRPSPGCCSSAHPMAACGRCPAPMAVRCGATSPRMRSRRSMPFPRMAVRLPRPVPRSPEACCSWAPGMG